MLDKYSKLSFLVLIFLFNFGSVFSQMEIFNEVYSKPIVKNIEGFDLVYFNNSELISNYNSINEPSSTFIYDIPRDVIVNKFYFVGKGNFNTFNWNIPIKFSYLDNDVFSKISCSNQKRPSYINDFTVKNYNRTYVGVEFIPLELVSCSDNKWGYYDSYDFIIEYNYSDVNILVNPINIDAGLGSNFNLKFDRNITGNIFVFNGDDEGFGPYFVNNSDSLKVSANAVLTDLQKFNFFYSKNSYENSTAVKYFEKDLSWGTIVGRVINTNNDSLMEVALEINNINDFEIPIDLLVYNLDINETIYDAKFLTLYARPNAYIYFINFTIDPKNKLNDLIVEANYNGLNLELNMNSLLKFEKSEFKDGRMPQTPGEILAEEIQRGMINEEYKNIDIESYLNEDSNSNSGNFWLYFWIIFGIVSFGGFGYYIFKLYKEAN